MSFLEDLAAAKDAPRPTLDVVVLLNGTQYVLRFTRMSGIDWGNLVDKHPPRIGKGKQEAAGVADDAAVLLDIRYGYNVRAVTREACTLSGVVVDGEPLTADQWTETLTALDGAAHQRITDAIFDLNEYGPQAEVDAARKGPKPSRKS